MSDVSQDAPRNDFERGLKTRIKNVSAFFVPGVDGPKALVELIKYLQAEIEKSEVDLREELKIEDERCEHCKALGKVTP